MTAIEIIRANPGLTAPELAAKFNRSYFAFYSAAKQHCIDLPKTPMAKRAANISKSRRKSLNSDAREEYIRANFHTMRAVDIAAELGVTKVTVYYTARRIGLKRTKEEQEAVSRAAHALVGETRRRNFQIRRQKQLAGEEQPSRSLNVFASERRKSARKWLVHEYGYIYLENDYFNLGYDGNTDRCTEWGKGRNTRKPEEYYTTRHGIRFFNIDE